LERASPTVPECVQREEVDDDRDAALSASATLANESQDPTVGRLDQFKELLDLVDPPIPILLRERDDLWEPPKMLWEVRVRLSVPPEQLDLWSKSFRIGFAGQLTAHERIEGVDALADRVSVLRHRRRTIPLPHRSQQKGAPFHAWNPMRFGLRRLDRMSTMLAAPAAWE